MKLFYFASVCSDHSCSCISSRLTQHAEQTTTHATHVKNLISKISAIQLKIRSARKSAHAHSQSRRPEVLSAQASSAQTQ